MLVFEILGTLYKMMLLKQQFDSFEPWYYFKTVIRPLIYVFIIGVLFVYFESMIFVDNLGGLIAFILTSCLTLIFVIYFIGLEPKEKEMVHVFIINKCMKK